MKQLSFCAHIGQVMLLVALLLSGWQTANAGAKEIQNKGTYDPSVVYPWTFVGVHYDEFWKDNNQYRNWSGNDKDAYIWEDNYSADGGKPSFGYKIDRLTKDEDGDKHTVNFRAYYQFTKVVPPYAVYESTWNYYFSAEGDKGKSAAHVYVFDSTQTYAETRDLYIYPGAKASNNDKNNHTYVIVAWHEDRGDGSWGSRSTGVSGSLDIKYDNQNGNTSYTIYREMFNVACFYAKSTDGHVRSSLRTESFSNTLYYPRFNGKGTKENPLQIATGADLKAFATVINSGVEGTADLYAILTNDIDYTNYTDASAMIGTYSHPYEGIFDGQGHSVTVAIDNTTEEYTGLFGCVNGATIMNMQVNGSVKGLRMIGGVVGNAVGNTTIENVLSTVTLTGTNKTEGFGGIASGLGDDKNACVFTITNCAYSGSLSGSLGGATFNGFGYVRTLSTSNMTNCYLAVSSEVTGLKGGENFAVLKGSSAKYTVTNCYYTRQIGSSTQGIYMTDEQMRSGEVCWKLNGSKNIGEPWLQTIGTNRTPQLWNALPVYEQNGQYFNFKPSFRGAGTELDPFQIEDVEQLEKFRDIVNAGNYSLCCKLVADIDLANRNWEPIGRHLTNKDSAETYSGTFDGNGYIISNLNSNTGVDYHAGLFGAIKDATIRNIIIRNATVIAQPKGHAGTVVGRSETSVIENCGVYGIISLSGGNTVNGIACGGTIKNSYTVYSNVTQGQSAQVENCYCGTDVEKMHASGELTYKLNNTNLSPWVQTLGRDEYPLLRGAQSVTLDGGTYKNTSYSGDDELGFIETTSGKDFRVIHHGGRLYEFIITMATQDGNGVHISPDVTISYFNDNWAKAFALSDVNEDSLSFSQDWWGKIDIVQGVTYDTKTYDKQVPTFWIRQGNHSTCKQTSLLWVAPQELTVLPSKFQCKGSEEESQFILTANTEETVQPDDDSGLTFIDPMVAVTNKTAGSQMVVVSSANKSYSLGLWDATDNYFITTDESVNGTTSMQAYLPPVECYHNIVALTFTRFIETDAQGTSDTTFINYAYPMVQKPTHSIIKTNITNAYNANNLLEWAIAFPNDTDVLNTDQILLARGYKSDYSDLSSQVAFGLMDASYTTTENDTLFGWFSYLDTAKISYSSLVKTSDTVSAFDTWDIPQSAKEILKAYKYPAQYMYYQAYRPTVTSMWSDNAPFKKQWKVLQRTVLPTVDSVRIIKDADFEHNHKVTVRVIMNNPYPWDLVDESDRSAVMLEARRQLFDKRMFQWDENASIALMRFSNSEDYDGNTDVILKYLTLSGNQVKQDSATGAYYAEYQDIVSIPFVHYHYQAEVKANTSYYPIITSRNDPKVSTDPCYTEEFGGIRNFRATRGTYMGAVQLTWEADETVNTKLTLQRREYKRGYDSAQALAGWTTITAADGSATDDKAGAAVVNEYVLTITTTYRDTSWTQSDTTYGYSGYYGSLNGRVKMPNGVNMPGDVHVMVDSKGAFTIQEITDPRTGEVILPAFRLDSTNYTLRTDKNGAYRLDSIPFYGSGRKYTVYAACGTATFVSPSGSSATIDLNYEDANYDYADIDFTCNDTKHFSGRILYTNSTVPVRDVLFKVNGTVLRDAEGEPVKTDAMGNFSFVVPSIEVTVQAYKEGHQMSNDGYILGGENADTITFTPTHDYDGLTIDDDTKVRLVGRVAGGVVQGAKPLGFGAGKNNLGDSITLVLTLEGNHTSYLYFDKKNPDKTSYTAQFTQPVLADMGTEQRIPTDVSFEAKRIVVKADNETGEFCLDLFPTKYIVSQVYANGYSTLYSEGEGSLVVDLCDSVGLHTHFYDTTTTSTQYDASLSKIYHAPVQVDLLQLRNSKFQPIYGEETMEVSMLSGTQQMHLSWMDTTETAHYAMGHPVFKGNKAYYFQVSAYEPYYYNNVSTGTLDRVPMAGYEATIHNGLRKFNESEAEAEEKLLLSPAGLASFSVTPNNTSFAVTEEEALHYLSASVDINGYHYESEQIGSYITGERDYGVEVVDAMEGAPQILDYIRDPYGSGSYAYRTEGTSYNWSRSYEKETEEFFEMDLSIGVGLIKDVIFGVIGSTSEYEISVNGNMTAISQHDITSKDGAFSLTLNEQISTSDDPIDQGAIADVYIGSVSTADVVKYQAFNVVDSITYQALLPAIETGGSTHLVAEGQDENGHPYYLVVCGGVAWQPGTERVFAYSQRHIMNMLIPNLEARRSEALRLASSVDEANRMASASGKTFYYINDEGEYEPVFPPTMTLRKDTVELLTNQIKEWQNIIAENERQKYEMLTKKADINYSVANVTIEHSEEASTYYRVRTSTGPKPVTGGGGGGSGNSDMEGKGDNDKNKTGLDGLGILYNVQLSGGVDESSSNEINNYTTMDGGSGFVIASSDNSYFDIDVYYQKDSSLIEPDSIFMSEINAYEDGTGLDGYAITNAGQYMTADNTCVHNYVFVMRGGATREPWIDADSTVFYMPDGERLPLGARSLKIDNPKIYVEQPVLYNVPQDEKAVFTLHISNETELESNTKDIISTVFLHVTDDSNPYGAKLSVDGVPLHNYMEFYIDPGMSITKTLEVERGSKVYDYEDIYLEVSDESYRQWDDATISVHYLPTSTPVTLTLPTQNFLINTLSQTDEEGKYYIPVQIEGFSTTKYDNFDHIELQYKRQTDGEDQWVNQCSYYADEQLYAAASGTKAMIETEGKIANIRFYGEQDPVEQKYDLRAVSFCRLGNGYTTRYSSVISGTKDTRCPEVFGLPKPQDGILEFDDVISLPFTEPIAYNYLDETANFSVQGYTNNSDADNSVTLYFSRSKNQSAQTQVTRVLNLIDFSVEMNVQVDKTVTDSMAFLSIDDEYSEDLNKRFTFGYWAKQDVLVAAMNGQRVYSEPLKQNYDINLTSALTHVGLVYTILDSSLVFYVGEQKVKMQAQYADTKLVCHANGNVRLGTEFKGRMNNIRLWSKALNAYEMSSKYKKVLSGNEANLLGYWPADEGIGTSVKDVASGANLTLQDVTWNLPNGYSVALNHNAMDILSDQALKYTRNEEEDYTISFYFKVDTLHGYANLFAAGSDGLEETGQNKVRIRFINNQLYFVSEGQQYSFGDNDLTSDADWHYLAVTVNHAQNKAALFIDGQMVNEISADAIGGVAGSVIRYGDESLSAHFDQIQMWSMALPASYIKRYYNAALTGKEKELQIYLPFEREEMNDQGTMYTTFSAYNHVIPESADEIVGDTVINETLVTADSKVISPVHSTTGIENLPFRWKSTENELQIEITKSNADINNQQLSLVVRRVEDLNGNPMQNAQMWTTYVNRNVLTWLIDPRTIVLTYGQDTTFTALFSNVSGRELNYTINCTCPYIELSNTMGTIDPLSKQGVVISVGNGLAPGIYQTSLNLIDENGLCSELTLNIRVKAEEPDWQVATDSSYNQSMDVIGIVKKQDDGVWSVDMCVKDKVAAFIDRECVGVANLSVDVTNNTSHLYMTVHGKNALSGEVVEFRLWDALTGKTYILDTDPDVTFAAKTIAGVNKPVEMLAYEMRIQTIDLNKGWNWISLYVDPFSEKGLNNLFSNQKQLTTNDVFRTPFGSSFATYQENGTWDKTMDDLEFEPNNVYHIYAQNEASVEVSGSLYEDPSITLDFTQSEWAQLAYLYDQSQPIRQALSDFVAGSERVPAGTIIKGYETFAVANADGTWAGSLEYLRPGEGYFVRRNGLRDSVTIHYAAITSAPERKTIVNRPSSIVNQSSTMMPVIAAFADGDLQDNDILLAIVGKEVIAVTEATDNLFFVSLHANQAQTVQFAKVRNGEIVAVTTQGLKYDEQGVAGTIESPYLIDFTQTDDDAPIYDILGLKYDYLDAGTPRVLIQGTKKTINY